MAVLAATVQAAGTSLDALAGIYLVGGSSRIPLVATLIAERLRVVPVNLDQPETAVALGAHHVGEDGTSLRTRDVPPQHAETRTVAINPPPRPAAPPPMRPPAMQPGYPAPPAPGYGQYGTGQPWAQPPKPPKTAAEKLGVIGCIGMFVLALVSLWAMERIPAIGLLSVPLFYGGLRIAGVAIYGVVDTIMRPAYTDASDLVLPGICGGVAIVLAVIPLSVRAVRESKRPPAPVR